MRRVAVAGAIAALGGGAALAGAQTPVPTVTVSANPTAVTVAASGPIAAGPTRLNVVRPAGTRADVAVYVGLLIPGVSLEEFNAALARRGEDVLGLVSVQASTALAAGVNSRAVTMNVKAGLTYVVVAQAAGESRNTPHSSTTFAVGPTASGAAAPAVDATIRMAGLRFRGARSLPRNGTVRVQNRSGTAHIAIAFPLRRGVTTARFGRALRSDNERAFGRVLAGAPYALQEVLSGATSNDQEVRFARSGRYALVCFVDEHHRLGMYRIVNVR